MEDKTYYLEMHDRSEVIASRKTKEIEIKDMAGKPEFNQRMYCEVGEQWQWIDRREWSAEQWAEYLADGDHRTYAGYVDGVEIGYFELECVEGQVEIVYFGLLPSAIGQGIGGQFLTACLEQAWKVEGAQRVWVHTCTLDHEYALASYQSRGLKLYDTVNEIV